MGSLPRLTVVSIELAVWLGLSAIAYALTFEFADEIGTYAWGAASWPRAVILLIAVGALAQFAVQLCGRAPAAPDAVAAPVRFRVSGRSAVKVTGSLALPLVYVYLLPNAGFYIATPIFLAAYLLLLGERRPAVIATATLTIYAAINLVFTKLFYVALPTGNWPGFYDVSNWFLVTLR